MEMEVPGRGHSNRGRRAVPRSRTRASSATSVGRSADLRPARHHDRQGHLRRRRQPARAEVCGDRAAAGGRGKVKSVRQLGGAGDSRRREGDGDRGQHAAREVRAARRRRGRRRQHLGRAQGRDALQIEWDDGPHAVYNTEQYHQEMLGDRRAARQGGPQSGRCRGCAGQRGQEAQRRVLPAAHGAHRHGAAGGAGQRRRRQVEVWAPVQSP